MANDKPTLTEALKQRLAFDANKRAVIEAAGAHSNNRRDAVLGGATNHSKKHEVKNAFFVGVRWQHARTKAIVDELVNIAGRLERLLEEGYANKFDRDALARLEKLVRE